jgi:hypothetical protein
LKETPEESIVPTAFERARVGPSDLEIALAIDFLAVSELELSSYADQRNVNKSGRYSGCRTLQPIKEDMIRALRTEVDAYRMLLIPQHLRAKFAYADAANAKFWRWSQLKIPPEEVFEVIDTRVPRALTGDFRA